jgi:hypothetical protein
LVEFATVVHVTGDDAFGWAASAGRLEMVNDARTVNTATTEHVAIAGNVRRDRADLTRCSNLAAFLVSSRRSTRGAPSHSHPAAVIAPPPWVLPLLDWAKHGGASL